jgi:hypothetical protein
LLRLIGVKHVKFLSIVLGMLNTIVTRI